MKIIFSIFILVQALLGTTVEQIHTKITNVEKKTATISQGNLKVGQSGIIIDDSQQSHSIIALAVVQSSSSGSSKIQILPNKLIEQDAIPTSKINPSVGHTVILNHLYNTALVIAPNIETKNAVQDLYKGKVFISEDFFAAFLKLEQAPVPEKKLFQEFCLKNQIGLIYFAVEGKIYTIDTVSFKIIDENIYTIKNKSEKLPFFTRIEKIELGLFDYGEESIRNYNKYYLKLLGKKDDR